MKLATYLFFPGNCAEALAFYQSIFGTEPSMRMSFGDGPPEMGVEDADKTRIMHATLPIGDDVLLLSDVPSANDSGNIQGSNFAVSVQPGSQAEADRIFAALTEGGRVDMPLADMFWGDYFGMGADKFGIQWMVNYAE